MQNLSILSDTGKSRINVELVDQIVYAGRPYLICQLLLTKTTWEVRESLSEIFNNEITSFQTEIAELPIAKHELIRLYTYIAKYQDEGKLFNYEYTTPTGYLLQFTLLAKSNQLIVSKKKPLLEVFVSCPSHTTTFRMVVNPSSISFHSSELPVE